MVYFSTNYDVDDEVGRSGKKSLGVSNCNRDHPVLKGRLHFVKFQTSKINDCLEFIKTKKLHLGGMCAMHLHVIATSVTVFPISDQTCGTFGNWSHVEGRVIFLMDTKKKLS